MALALLAALGLGGMGLGYTLWAAWTTDARRTRRVLRRARVSSIAGLVDGRLACIVGKVELDGQPLVALMSRQSCVAYETTVQVFDSKVVGMPSKVEVERRLVPFYIVDDTGRARIEAPEAALCNQPVARSERYEERIIQHGDRVRIVGSVVLEPTIATSPEHGFREGRMKATLTGSHRYPLLIDVDDRSE
jgi:hypothetical protein